VMKLLRKTIKKCQRVETSGERGGMGKGAVAVSTGEKDKGTLPSQRHYESKADGRCSAGDRWPKAKEVKEIKKDRRTPELDIEESFK